MNLNKNEVHLWSTSLLISPAELAAAKLCLSSTELAQASRLRLPLHQHRYIASHAWLRRILSIYLTLPPSGIAYTFSAHQKPSLTGSTSIEFNLSHSGDLALCAITHSNPVGIDVELLQQRDFFALSKRYFSPIESNELENSPSHAQMALFYRLWTRKEAILKASGKGLSTPLNQFTVSGIPETQIITLQDNSWFLFNLEVEQPFQSACATARPVEKITYFTLIDGQPQMTKETHI